MSEIFIPARLKGFPLLTAGKLYDCHLFIWETKKLLDFHGSGNSMRESLKYNHNQINKRFHIKKEKLLANL